MKRQESERVGKVAEAFERLYPLIFSLIITAGYWLLDIEFKDSLSELLSICISFSSILLGFIGVLIALLFSLNKNAVKEYILVNYFYRKRIYCFFTGPLRSGFFLILISLLFYVRNTLSGFILFRILWDIIKTAWLFALVYFAASSYRLIRVVLKIAFYKDRETDEDNKEDGYDLEAYRKIQEKHELKGKDEER